MPDKKDLKIAKEIKKELKEKLGDKLISVILYGSRARGDSRDESDMDLLILIQKNNTQIENKIFDVVYNFELKNNFQIYVSPMIYSSGEYKKRNNPPTSFFYTINKDMVKI